MIFAWKYSSSIRFAMCICHFIPHLLNNEYLIEVCPFGWKIVFYWNFSKQKALWFLEFLESIFILPLPQNQITFWHETPCRSIDMTSYRGVGSNQNMGGQIVNRLTIAWFSVPWVIHQKLRGQMPIQTTQLLRPCHSYHLSTINIEVTHCMVRNLDVPTRLFGLLSSFK